MLNYFMLFFLVGVTVCEEKRPNIVLVLTDDQDEILGGMTPMKNVRRFIGNEGVTFTNSYVSSPICCPSRASLLTGLYVHNHKTVNNSLTGGCYGDQWRNTLEKHTFATMLHDTGYETFYAGKYLNEYGAHSAGGPELVPPGWSEWHGLVGNSVYYNYTISNNGVPTHSTDQYLTDVIRDLAVSYIENQTESSPFLMVLAPPAPHQPFTPAPRHEGKFNNVSAVRHPNFNIAVEDKHWLLRMPPSPLPASLLPELDRAYRSRWEALLAVDELVADVIDTLETRGFMENTYVIYTSDNGYHIGQFSQVYDKRQPYESDIKVPLLIKGPGIKPNTTYSSPVLNIDIGPTIVQLAGLTPEKMDGRPISLEEDGSLERYMLVEYNGMGSTRTVDNTCPWKFDGDDLDECYPAYGCKCQDSRNNTFACVQHFAPRIHRKYCEFADQEKFVEFYDLISDPYELINDVNDIFPAVKHWYKLALTRLLGCVGANSCNDPFVL
ncbi:N-acetylglucosamine-6-sulfatase-like [Anticarsia gemmatalis]|uniref:N-acetylglucosamine-6-sulfatase-like n=1 Tax=Anticarsia gemmatalis TaxID=129554 RepID=UPI003F775DEB